jgi:RNA polymerase subunit RPABC4/transcription elongation factor Spt4
MKREKGWDKMTGYCKHCGLMQGEGDKQCPKCEGVGLTQHAPAEKWQGKETY